MRVKMHTITAGITLGYNEGYNHSNEEMTKEEIANIINEVEAKAEQDKAISQYISFVITLAKCLYKEEWGCPPGGENVFVLNAVANLQFTESLTQWEKDVLEITEILKARLKQSTVMVTFTTTDACYIKE